MSLKISLTNHPDKFVKDSQELLITKKVNFIFGKNGTGKTTIADEIYEQLSEIYNVCVFKDFDGVVENDRLNAIALGTKNVEIQKHIDIIDVEIARLQEQIVQPESKDIENTYTKALNAQKAYSEQDRSINAFFTQAAAQIKNKTNPQIAKPSYDKNRFQEDMRKANLLSDDDVKLQINIIKSDEKPDISAIVFPSIDLVAYIKSTNEILVSCIPQPQDIPELKDNTDKQNFAKKGMSIHEHRIDEMCAFCGNRISDERWELLGSYFNDEVKKFEQQIDREIAAVESMFNMIKAFELINESDFYDKFKQQIESLNLRAKNKKSELREFLDSLLTSLKKKKGSLFLASEPLELTIPLNFSDLEKEYCNLINANNELSKNLKVEQNKAKDALRYHEVKALLDGFKYDDEHTKLASLESIAKNLKDELDNKKAEMAAKQDARKGLIAQTKDEKIIADKISDLLKNAGMVSFSLQLVENDDEGQKGQYQIIGHDGSSRPVTHLSKGEKNIIAFLYFIFSLDGVDGNRRNKIIVLDDPMTSNDDTMQYLMIGEIQRLFRGLNDGNYLVVLTHNCHFYLNVRPNTSTVTYDKNKNRVTFYDKNGIYHLFSDGKHTTIKSITDGKHDFSTSYETLWKELRFLYQAPAATSDLLLSPCRKICETYKNFTKQDVMAFYRDNISAKKLFDVNAHAIDDMEAEANTKTKAEIIRILYSLFEYNNAEEHIKSYWGEEKP